MRKTIALLLCFCLLVGCLAACAKKDDSREEETAAPPLSVTYDAAYSSYDESVYSAYETLCTAIMNGETAARFNVGLMEDVLQLFYTSFPPGVLVKVTENPDGSGAVITYPEDAEATKQQIADFAQAVNDIKTQCFDGTVSQTVYALNAYQYIAQHYQPGDADNVFQTVMQGAGTSDTYTRLFEYLLQQAGIPAYHIIATDTSGAIVPMSEALIDGQLYYFDVTLEAMMNDGGALRYFGMTSGEVTANNITKTMYTNMADSSVASDLRFDSCRHSLSWEISGASLLVTMDTGIIAEIAL